MARHFKSKHPIYILVYFTFCIAHWQSNLLEAAPQGNSDQTRAIMNQLAQDLAQLYPLSLQPESFYEKSNSSKIDAFFKNLQNSTKTLKSHMSQDENYAFISQALARDIDQASEWYKRGRPQEAGFVISHLVENCFACHTKLPTGTKQFANMFITEEIKKKLPGHELAKLYVATRQFNDALNLYEKNLKNVNQSTLEYYSKGLFIEYFKLALQVEQSPDRALKLIKEVLAKDHLTYFLETVLKQWVKDLEDLSQTKVLSSPSLPLAKTQIDKARTAMRYNTDQAGVVRLVAAASMIQRNFLNQPSRIDLADSFYYLGYIENQLAHSFWLTESRYYLEKSINQLPHSPISEKAYLLLEEQITLGYTGSSGTHIPKDISKWLSELRVKALSKKSKI